MKSNLHSQYVPSYFRMPATQSRLKNEENEKDVEKVKKQFVKKLFSGRIMSQEELANFTEDKDLNVEERVLKKIRYQEEESARFSNKRKVVAYATTSFPHHGEVHVDFANYKRENKAFNDGMIGQFFGG